MSGDLSPFSNFNPCRTDCNFFHEGIKGCILSNGIIMIFSKFGGDLEKIEKHCDQTVETLINLRSDRW